MKPLDGRIAIALEGESIDLDDACMFFSEDIGIQVRRIHIPPNDKVVLLADDLNDLTDEQQICSTATRYIDLINGILFLENTSRVPIQAQGIVHRQSANGNWGVTIWVPSVTIRVRSQLRLNNRNPGEPSRQALLLRDASKSKPAHDVLIHLRGRPEWFDLYKAYELMRADISRRLGSNGRAAIGWPSRTKISHFTKSAQLYRHAKGDWPNGITLESAMSLKEARNFIKNLCSLWLQSF